MADVQVINQLELGLERLLTQWKDSPNINGILKAYLISIQEIEIALYELIDDRRLVSAVGIQLDIIGAKLGQARNGATDDDYRLDILARVMINISQGNESSVVTAVRAATRSTRTDLVEYPPRDIKMNVDGILPLMELRDAIMAGMGNFTVVATVGEDAIWMKDVAVTDPLDFGLSSLSPSTVNNGTISSFLLATSWPSTSTRLTFNGTSQFVRLNTAQTLPVAGSSFSVSCMVSADTTGTTGTPLSLTPLTNTNAEVSFIFDDTLNHWHIKHVEDDGTVVVDQTSGYSATLHDMIEILIGPDDKPSFLLNGILVLKSPNTMASTTVAFRGVGAKVLNAVASSYYTGEIWNIETSDSTDATKNRAYPLTNGTTATVYDTNAAGSNTPTNGGSLSTMREY